MRILFLANWPRTRAKGGDYAFFKHFEARPELSALTTFSIPIWTWFERRVLKFYPLQAIKAWLISRRFDLIIAYSSQSGLPLALLRRLLGDRGVPLVLHDVENMGRVSGPLGPIVRFALGSVQRIVTPSSGQLEQYRRRFPAASDRAISVPIGIGPYPRPPDIGEALAGNRIVAMGREDQGRRFRDWPVLLDALQRVNRPFELLIVGRQSLSDADRGCRPLPASTRFIPYTPGKDLVPTIGGCRIAVLPLPDRGQSQGQLTALFLMACGRPLIAADVLGLADYVEDGRNGLLYRPGDAADLARLIELLLDDDDLCRRLSERAHGDATGKFTDAAMGREWERICLELIRP